MSNATESPDESTLSVHDAPIMKSATTIAQRCICLELLAQRLWLETDLDDPVAERDEARALWLSRVGDLEIDAELLTEERAFLERNVGDLTDDDVDDVHGRASSASVLLWVLGRSAKRPLFATEEELAETLAKHGLLGDGSIAGAKAEVEKAASHSEKEIAEALSTYRRTRGKAKTTEEPEKIFAEVAAHALTWVLDPEMSFDDDISLD